MITTIYGPATIICPGVTRTGAPGWLVCFRRADCPGYPWAKLANGKDAGGQFAFAVVEKGGE
jgi:hypothetical protein